MPSVATVRSDSSQLSAPSGGITAVAKASGRGFLSLEELLV